jgi:omega-amidase
MMVYGCQLDIVWENKPENFRRVELLLRKRRISPGSLVVLPEMFATGFSMNASCIAEPKNGLTTSFLRLLARKHRAFVLGGLVRRGTEHKTFNEAICLAPSGKCVARYAKLHLFTPGAESAHYSAGDHLAMFRWANLKVAVFICYDLRFPEAFRLAGSLGAQVMVVIANWPKKRHSHWLALLRARAIENQVYVIGINRCGRDPKLGYDGGSLIIDPHGNAVASAGRQESVLAAKLDPIVLSRWRKEFPALKDIRTEIILKKTSTTTKPRQAVKTIARNSRNASVYKTNRSHSRLSTFPGIRRLSGRA